MEDDNETQIQDYAYNLQYHLNSMNHLKNEDYC